jgi:hypothetical protein
MTHTFTRTHVFVEFADPYLTCDTCKKWVTAWHNNDQCGCDETWWNEPCGCIRAGTTSVCPSWSPVDGCTCLEVLGRVDHGSPDGL